MNGKLNDKFWGIALIVIGTLLILQQFGILKQRLDFYVVLFLGLFLIAKGLVKLNGKDYMKKFMKKDE